MKAERQASVNDNVLISFYFYPFSPCNPVIKKRIKRLVFKRSSYIPDADTTLSPFPTFVVGLVLKIGLNILF